MDLNQEVTITAPVGVFTTALAGMRKLPLEQSIDAYMVLEQKLAQALQPPPQPEVPDEPRP